MCIREVREVRGLSCCAECWRWGVGSRLCTWITRSGSNTAKRRWRAQSSGEPSTWESLCGIIHMNATGSWELETFWRLSPSTRARTNTQNTWHCRCLSMSETVHNRCERKTRETIVCLCNTENRQWSPMMISPTVRTVPTPLCSFPWRHKQILKVNIYPTTRRQWGMKNLRIRWWKVILGKRTAVFCEQYTLTRVFSCTLILCAHALAWLKDCVVSMHAQFKMCVIGSRFVCMRVSLKIVPWHPHERSTFVSLSSSSSTSSTSQVTLPINKHCDDPQNEEYGSVAKTTSSTDYEPSVIDNFDYSEIFKAIFQNESVDVDTEPSYSFEAELDDELIRKSAITTVHSGARRISELETNLSLSWRKCVTSSVNFFTRTSTGKPVTNQVQNLSWKRKSSLDLENKQIKILFGRHKEQILAEVRSEIQKHEFQAESDRRNIQVLTGIIDSQRMEIDHTFTGCVQSKRDQLLLQERISQQNRDLRETWIKNIRDMEELRKSHVLKVEELSRRKLTEDFEAVTSLFQSSNVKTVYNLSDNDAKYPGADQEFAGFTTVPSGARKSASLLQAFTHKENACFNVHIQFLTSTGKPVTGCHKKRKFNQELDNCQNRITFGKTAKSEILRHEYTADLAEKIVFWIEEKKLILTQWKLRILEQGMNSPVEYKLFFTKDWQLENEHFVILVSEVFKSWKNWREIRNFDSRNFREEEWSKIIWKMSNLYGVDKYFTFPINQRFFLFLVNQEDCWAATKICSQIFGIRTENQETFLDGLHANTSTSYSGMLDSRDFSVTGNIPVQASKGKPVPESGDRDHNQSLSQNGKNPKQFSIFTSNFWFLKRPSTGILTLFQKECI